jgi:hypothetical protein
MPFPNDLSDLLPLIPGTGVTRRLPIFGHVIFVELKRLEDEKYSLFVYDQFNRQTRRRFGADQLITEEEVEIIWREFLDERKSIFTHDGASDSRL